MSKIYVLGKGPAQQHNRHPVRVCPACGASWTLLPNPNSIGDLRARTKCPQPKCGTDNGSHFSPTVNGNSYPLWDEEQSKWVWVWPPPRRRARDKSAAR